MLRRRILVAEDEFFIAMDLEQTLADLGYECVGPFNTLAAARDGVLSNDFDAAILNLVLRGERADEVALILEERGIPFAFATGVRAADHDPRWHKRRKIFKPYTQESLIDLLIELIPAVEYDRATNSAGILGRRSRSPGQGDGVADAAEE